MQAAKAIAPSCRDEVAGEPPQPPASRATTIPPAVTDEKLIASRAPSAPAARSWSRPSRASNGSERLGRRHASRSDRGQQTGDRADHDRGREAARPRGRRYDDGPVLRRRIDGGRRRARGDTGRTADEREEDRLGQELRADLPLRRAE